jgi:hypothetical protein
LVIPAPAASAAIGIAAPTIPHLSGVGVHPAPAASPSSTRHGRSRA